MKKTGVLFIAFFLLILFSYKSGAIIEGSLISWKADNISGWLCDTEVSRNLDVTFIFSKGILWQDSFLLNIPQEIDSNGPVQCNGHVNYFNFNLYKNFNYLNLEDLLSHYPLDFQVHPDGASPWFNQKIDFSCRNPNQTILKMIKPKNAHVYLGEQSTLANMGEEEYPICYERIFGYEYAGNSAIYSLNCEKPVLYKFLQENTHVANSSFGGLYAIDLCYADLICISRETNCLENEKLVLKLDSSSNSHVSDSIDSNYPISVCCNTSYLPPIPNPIKAVKWVNLYNQEITNANKEDFVKIYLESQNLAGQYVNYSIYNSSNYLVYFEKKLIANENSSLIWQAIPGNYTFNAVVSNVSYHNLNSKQLNVSNECGERDFKIKIINPRCGDNFTILNEINFSLNISSPNLYINGTINLSNKIISFNNRENNVFEFENNYSQDIVAKISAYGLSWENTGNLCEQNSRKNAINLIIINKSKSGSYSAACIDSPEDYYSFSSSRILCNASSTQAINYTADSEDYRLIDLNNITFKWEFSDGSIHEFIGKYNSTKIPPCYDTEHKFIDSLGVPYIGMIECESATKGWLFTKYLRTAGEHSVNLIINISE